MKIIQLSSLVLAAAVVCGPGAKGAAVFEQDFAGGGTVASYVNASPGSGQWNAISSSGAAKTWSVASNALSFASTGGNGAFVSRNTNFAPTLLGVEISFTFNFTNSATALTSAFHMMLGSAFDTANAVEANGDTYAKFGFNFTNSDGFQVRDVSGGTSGATVFGLGAYEITWVLNNTGSAFSYEAPDGSFETLANDTWDLWVGTSKQLNDRAVTTAGQSITDWKFGFDGAGTYSATFDNFQVAPIPEPTTAVMLLGGIGTVLLFRCRRLS